MTKIPAPDIPVPVHVGKNKIPSTTTITAFRKNPFISSDDKQSTHSNELVVDSDGDDEGEATAKEPETINFVVMLKKNNKPQVNFFIDFSPDLRTFMIF